MVFAIRTCSVNIICFAVAGGKGIQQIHNVAVANILWLIQSKEDFDKIPCLLTCTSYDPSNETRICNFLLKVATYYYTCAVIM